MTRVLLTGAAGFVGSHVLRHVLQTTDWDVSATYTFRHKGLPARLESAICDTDWADRVDAFHCDLAAPVDPMTYGRRQLEQTEVILNVASESHVDRSIEDPVGFVRNNVDVALNVAELARRMPNLKVVVQVSTDEVYGPAPAGYASREWDPILPSSPYSASKAAQEAVWISYWRTFGVPLILTNTMNLVGEMQDAEKFVPSTLAKLLAGERVRIHGQVANGDWVIGSRYYLHARNQADALLFLARRALEDPAQLETERLADLVHGQWHHEAPRYAPGVDRPPRFHVVGERELTNLELADYLRHVLIEEMEKRGEPLHPLSAGPSWYDMEDFHSSRPGHDLRYALDGSKLASLGWTAPVPLLDSLARTVAWTLDHREWLR